MKKEFSPKVSILISVYNGEATLDKCLKSLLVQSYQNFEVICVDDDSRDNSFKKMNEWLGKFGSDRFFILKNKENLGLTKSLNLAIEKASGEYMARIDADDFWDKNKLEKQIGFLKNHPEIGILGSNFINAYKNGKSKYFMMDEDDIQIRKRIFRKNPFSHSCVIAQLDLIRNAGKYDENLRYGQDYELWLRCLPLTKFHNFQDFLCTRTIGTGDSLKKQKQQMLQGIKTKIKYIKKYGYNPINYIFILEPLIIYLSPEIIKKIKRKLT